MPMILALKRMISPKSVAFIGGWEAETALRVTRKLGFPGRIYAVNPRRDSLAGVTCLASLADLPEAPDCAFVAVKREPAVEMVRTLAHMGVGGVVLYTAGFAELDEAGKTLQAELIEGANGLLQRAGMWPPLLWMSVVSIRLYSLAPRPGPATTE